MQSVLSDAGKEAVLMRNERKESESFTDLPFFVRRMCGYGYAAGDLFMNFWIHRLIS